MAGRSRKRKRTGKGGWIGLLALVTAVWAATAWSIAGGTLGKYVLKAVGGSDSLAEKFYFASSQLKPDTEAAPEYDLTWWNTSQPLTFEIDLRNAVEKLNIAGRDIVYNVTAELGAEPAGTSLSGASATTALGGSTAPQPWTLTGKTRQEQMVKVTLNPPSSPLPSALNTVMITVTATSKSPYIQSLKAVYKVHISKDGELSYYVNDAPGKLAAELFFEIRDAWPSDTADVALTWPEGLYPDESSELFGKLSITGNAGRGAFNTGGKYRLLLMKTDTSKEYTTSQIGVKLP